MNGLAVYLAAVAAEAVFLGSIGTGSASAASTCAMTKIVKIAMPTGPARYEAGRMTLANGATLELAGALKSPAMYRVSEMHIGDVAAACYGPLTTYADAGPSRTITILDARNGAYYGTLIGTWKT